MDAFNVAFRVPNLLRDLFAEHDGLILASPEYNALPTPLLINSFDWLSVIPAEDGKPSGAAATGGKPVGLLAASPGALGGIRALPIVRNYLSTNFAMVVVPEQLALPLADQQLTTPERLAKPDLDAVLDFAAERYYETSGLFGTPDQVLPIVDKLHRIGVDEIACLVDFGVATETVLDNLPHLARVLDLVAQQATTSTDGAEKADDLSIAELVVTDILPLRLPSSSRSDDGEIMGLKHRQHPTFGVQFHPESILTEGGYDMLRNFLKWAR